VTFAREERAERFILPGLAPGIGAGGMTRWASIGSAEPTFPKRAV